MYTTDTRYTLEERQPTLPPPCAAGDPHASLAKGLSVAISRDWDHPRNLSVTRETYVPGRLLKGLLPDALVDESLPFAAR